MTAGIRVRTVDAIYVSPYVRVSVSDDKCIKVEFLPPFPSKAPGEARLCDSNGEKLAYIAKKMYQDIDRGELNLRKYISMVSSATFKLPRL